jgi:hypothetical protein
MEIGMDTVLQQYPSRFKPASYLSPRKNFSGKVLLLARPALKGRDLSDNPAFLTQLIS